MNGRSAEKEKTRYCRLCDIAADIPQDVADYADRLYQLLDERDRAGEELIKRRLAICGGCPKLVGDTCMACGCYVLIRASAKPSRCPKKKW